MSIIIKTHQKFAIWQVVPFSGIKFALSVNSVLKVVFQKLKVYAVEFMLLSPTMSLSWIPILLMITFVVMLTGQQNSSNNDMIESWTAINTFFEHQLLHNRIIAYDNNTNQLWFIGGQYDNGSYSNRFASVSVDNFQFIQSFEMETG